jgi:hypothetical protein
MNMTQTEVTTRVTGVSRHRLLAGLALAVVLVAALGAPVVSLVQVIRDPPPQHPELVLLGILGEAIDRLVWGLGAAAGMVALLIGIVAIISYGARERRWTRLSRFWGRDRPRGLRGA